MIKKNCLFYDECNFYVNKNEAIKDIIRAERVSNV